MKNPGGETQSRGRSLQTLAPWCSSREGWQDRREKEKQRELGGIGNCVNEVGGADKTRYI